MVVLKKLRSASLIETITASTLLMIVFVMALLVMNNVFSNSIKNDTSSLNNYLYHLQYEYKNNQISIPFTETYERWEIVIDLIEENEIQWLEFKATHMINDKNITKRILNGRH